MVHQLFQRVPIAILYAVRIGIGCITYLNDNLHILSQPIMAISLKNFRTAVGVLEQFIMAEPNLQVS
ncbi:hypothetical protein [Chryseobacterium gregarium]|uniref:hypothetical protein n=1 Tax=Chryseobacterium gregarium TaxID=456299 RepID=UPI000489AA50|nr:hypothetical protein [Chryseobacterium gregarium]